MKINRNEKIIFNVSLVNACTNLLLAITKILMGVIGFSQALLADGVHSFSDVVSDVLVFIAARASLKHPDKQHPYGYQRIETIGTVVIALILCGVAGSISYDAVTRLWHHAFQIPDTLVVLVAIISIAANELLFHYSRKQGEKIHSKLLINNAWHKRSDVLVSMIVLLSVIGSMIGWRWLDATGAIIISCFIFKMAITMLWQAAQEFMDRGVDEKILTEMQKIICDVPGVQSIHQLRTRLHANTIFLDLHIIVDPFISVSEGHHIGEQVHNKLMYGVKQLRDVTIHIDPENDETSHPSLHLPNREAVKKILESRWMNLPGYLKIKKITLHYLDGRLYIEVFLPNTITGEHTTVELLTQYRNAIADIHYIASVVIHFMPTNGNDAA